MRRRLEGVAGVSISQSQQTAAATFAPGDHVFSPREFRAAVDEAGVEVLAFQVDACGAVEARDGRLWLVAGRNRFVLDGKAGVPDGGQVCVTGRLDDSSTPHRLEVASVRP